MRHGAARRRSPGQGHAVGPLLDWDADEAETTLHHYDVVEIEAPRLEFEDEGWPPRPRVEPPPLPRDPRLQNLQPFRLPPTEFGREFGYGQRRRRGRGWLWTIVLVGAVALTVRFSPTARDLIAHASERVDWPALRERIAAWRASLASDAPAAPVDTGRAVVDTAPPAAADVPPSAPNRSAAPPSTVEAIPPSAEASQPDLRAEERPRARRNAPRHARQAAADREPPPSPIAEPTEPEPESTPPIAVAAEETGVLRINSLPWAEVSIDGNWVGTTPQREIKLSPGRHTVRLVNPELNMTRAFDVEISAGATVTKSVQLE